jgi:hypothetical protein
MYMYRLQIKWGFNKKQNYFSSTTCFGRSTIFKRKNTDNRNPVLTKDRLFLEHLSYLLTYGRIRRSLALTLWSDHLVSLRASPVTVHGMFCFGPVNDPFVVVVFSRDSGCYVVSCYSVWVVFSSYICICASVV